MKNFRWFVLAPAFFAMSCAGDSEDTNDTNENSNEVDDVVVLEPAFDRFLTYVSELPAELENIDSLYAKFEELQVEFSPDQLDTSYFVMRGFMTQMELSEEEAMDYTEKGTKRMEKKYGEYGFEVWYEEGYAYLIPEQKYLYKKFKKYISEDLSNYLDVTKVAEVPITNDAGIILPWSDLAEIVLACEEFLVEYPESNYFNEVMELYEIRLCFLMFGLENTPVINSWNEEELPQLEAEVGETYEKLIKDKKHKTGNIIADHLANLEAKNFVLEYSEMECLTPKKIKEYLEL